MGSELADFSPDFPVTLAATDPSSREMPVVLGTQGHEENGQVTCRSLETKGRITLCSGMCLIFLKCLNNFLSLDPSTTSEHQRSWPEVFPRSAWVRLCTHSHQDSVPSKFPF